MIETGQLSGLIHNAMNLHNAGWNSIMTVTCVSEETEKNCYKVMLLYIQAFQCENLLV